MKNLKKFIEYNFLGSKYKLFFELWRYSNNNNLYVGLCDKKQWSFCDVSENHGLLWDNEIILDNDFLDMNQDLKYKLMDLWILDLRWFTGIYKVDVKKIKDEYEYVEYK